MPRAARPQTELGGAEGKVIPHPYGNNLMQMFAQGQVAMWEQGDWNTLSVKSSVSFPVGVAMLPIGPDGRVSVFNGLIDGLNSHTPYPKQAWELEQWLGSPRSQAILGSGGYVWPADEHVWPGGLHRLAKYVRGRGMQFGLWIEPEMVSPDSDLYRAHPDWILAAGPRLPPLQRHQLVLDLTRPEVTAYLLDRISALISEYEIAYVKWDCNRDIIDAGSRTRAGAPAAHDQAAAVYALLDELRRRHPAVEWESCAAGGGRIDLAMLERVQRVWTSDMTDALARQAIQRWTGQLVPPEYLGAHISAPFSHQTGRYMPLSLRCGTALFGHFGIEWDLAEAGDDDLAELAVWIGLYKQHRALIHTGRVVRIDTPDDTAWMYGVVAADASAALMSYAQLDEPVNDQPTVLRVPGLDPLRRYRVTDVTPGLRLPRRSGLPQAPLAAIEVSGAALAEIGLAIPAQRVLTAMVMLIEAI